MYVITRYYVSTNKQKEKSWLTICPMIGHSIKQDAFSPHTLKKRKLCLINSQTWLIRVLFYLLALGNESSCYSVSVCSAQWRSSRIPMKARHAAHHAPVKVFCLSFYPTTSLLLLSLHVPKPLHYHSPDLREMYTEAHVSLSSIRRRAGPARQTGEEIPQAHMEVFNPLLTLRGILQRTRAHEFEWVQDRKKQIGTILQANGRKRIDSEWTEEHVRLNMTR